MDSDSQVSLVAGVLGGFILLYGLCSLGLKEKLYMSEALLATLYGIFIGPLGVGLIDLDSWHGKHELTREFSRIAIGVQVMVVGITLPKKYLLKEARSLSVLLIPVMSCMWLVSALCVRLLFPRLSFLEALMIASCFTPTDPVLANSIVHGHFAEKYVPENVRSIIVAESGANDGLGYPFLFLAILLIQMPAGEAWIRWTLDVMLYEVALSIAIGFITGFLARKVLRLANERKLVDGESFSIYALALALFLIGGVGIIGSDDLLACFIAGCSFTWDGWYQLSSESSRTLDAIDMILNLGMFIYIGAIMPWSAMALVGVWRLAVLSILVLLFRRLPIVALLYPIIPAVRNWKEAVFTGFFGPMGVGSVFYGAVAMTDFLSDEPNYYASQVLEPIVYGIVLSSIFVHGITIPVYQTVATLTRRFSRQRSSISDAERAPLTDSNNSYRSYAALQVPSETACRS